MMKLKLWLLLFICFVLVPAEVKGQQITPILNSFPVPEQLAVSSDNRGNILMSTPDGEIQKYSPEGTLLHTFSPQSASYFSTIDARFTMQVQAFDENSQQLIYLDRFLNQSGSIQLPSEHFNFASALGWSASGNTVWVFDASVMQLKRWRTDSREMVSALKISQLINAPLEVKMLHEHQHKLYMLGADRALVFDQNGSFEKQLALPAWKSATLSENDLLFLTEQNTIELIKLGSGKKEKFSFPEGSSTYQKILAVNKILYLFTDKQVEVYRLIP